jgi:hypothetical protein
MKKLLLLSISLALTAGAFAGEVGDSLTFAGQSAFYKASPSKSAAARAVRETGVCDAPQRPYDTVAINGIMPEGVTFELRPDGSTDWAQMTVKRFDNGRFWGKYEFPSLSTDKLEVRITSPSGAQPDIYDIEVFARSMTDADRPATTTKAAPALRDSGYDETVPGIDLIPRSEWGAKPATEAYTPHTPVMITVHHTAATQPMTREDGIKEMQFLQDLHQNTDGWIDIGYHFLIDGAGDIFEGRPMNVVGAHTEGKNTGNIGISMMGYFHPPQNNQPTDAQLASLRKIIQAVAAMNNIKMTELYAHRELNATDCPGDILYPIFQSMRTELQNQKVENPQNSAAPVLRSIDDLKTLQGLNK